MNAGGVALYALGVAYLVLGLVIINNHYFMPSLRRLSRRLCLSDDVAGALVTPTAIRPWFPAQRLGAQLPTKVASQSSMATHIRPRWCVNLPWPSRCNIGRRPHTQVLS